MDYQKFIEFLPILYENWNQESVHPKSNQFQKILEQVGGITTANIMQLLNFAINCLEPDEVYCEIGCSSGANLIAALYNHSEQMAYVVESLHDFEGEVNFNKLLENLHNFNLEEQVVVCNQSSEEFLFELREIETANKVGIYFDNGKQDYRTQLINLLLIRPLLANRALIVIGNANKSTVQQANWDFITAHPQCQVLLDLVTSTDSCCTLWNGIQVLSWDINRNYNYSYLDISKQQDEMFIKAISNLQFELDKKETYLEKIWQEALALDDYGYYEETEKKYKELLKWRKYRPKALLNLGTLYYKTNRYQLALELLLKSLELEPSKALHHYNIGLVLEKVGTMLEAAQAYQWAIDLEPEWIEPYNNLGNLFLKAGDIQQAELTYRAAITANPKHFGSYLNLGNVLMERHQIDEAIEIYKKAQELKPYHADILHNLGVALDAKNDSARAALHYGYAYYHKGKFEEAIKQFQCFLATQTGDINFYIVLAYCYRYLNRFDEAISTYNTGIKIYPKMPILHFSLAIVLQEFGYVEQAIVVLTKASELISESLTLKLVKQCLLPIIYETEVEIDFYRSQFTEGLELLVQQTTLDTSEARTLALTGIGSWTNFYLQYQGKNDLELQKRYGQFVCRVMATNYPQWVIDLPKHSSEKHEKIRIGYISSFLRNHNGANWALGWIKNHNRHDFKIYCYHTGCTVDQITQKFNALSDVFHHIPTDLEAVCNQILSDNLHILIFTDIGMDPLTTQIAGLRLAPVQCTAWGHPVTSGLPTIDYYLSSELMEPEGSQKHYSEQLVRLPNIGLCYAKPIVPQLTKTRLDFQLREDAVVYLSCQSLYKYLPQYDYVFAAIAQRVPHAQIAFLSHPSVHITEKFRRRLQRVFANFELNSKDYCVILPRQNSTDYLQLNLVSDIFIDTFSWNGGNSTLQAIACNLPIVTCPGEFMRGRHSCAILEMLGVTDTIAKDEAEYIEIAVRLGLDSERRNSIVERMLQRHSHLYDDKTCVEALDTFLRNVVEVE